MRSFQQSREIYHAIPVPGGFTNANDRPTKVEELDDLRSVVDHRFRG